MRFLNPDAIERLPAPVRFLLGCILGGLALAATDAAASYVHPLRAFPFILAFPMVVFSAWFVGMWGAAGCALAEVVLVDTFLTRSEFRLVTGSAYQQVRIALFLLVSLLLGWLMRRLSQQREELRNRDLQQKLMQAESDRLLAEERARTAQALSNREEMLRMALQANGMGLWVWDLIENTVHWSDEVFRIAGLEPGSLKLDPETWLTLVHPDDLHALQSNVDRARTSGGEYRHRYRVQRRDGTIRWLESQGKSQRDSEGRIIRLMGVMTDVTQRMHAEEGMLRAEKLAVAGRLAASVAHEINNPLEAVANMLYLITMSDTLESTHEYAARALDELMRISLIAQSTLKFHRQTGSPQMTFLSEVLETVLALFKGKLDTMQIAVRLQAEGEVPIFCMPGEAQQIFANLVSNAAEAMEPNGQLRIRIRSSLDWRDGTTRGVRVTVCDSGLGMDRTTMRRIFEPFYTTKPDTGTGLGLWVVAQLVERHKGNVRAWSSQRSGSSGTAFTVFLPIGNTNAKAGTVEDDSAVVGGKGPKREDPENAFANLFFGRGSS